MPHCLWITELTPNGAFSQRLQYYKSWYTSTFPRSTLVTSHVCVCVCVKERGGRGGCYDSSKSTLTFLVCFLFLQAETDSSEIGSCLLVTIFLKKGKKERERKKKKKKRERKKGGAWGGCCFFYHVGAHVGAHIPTPRSIPFVSVAVTMHTTGRSKTRSTEVGMGLEV